MDNVYAALSITALLSLLAVMGAVILAVVVSVVGVAVLIAGIIFVAVLLAGWCYWWYKRTAFSLTNQRRSSVREVDQAYFAARREMRRAARDYGGGHEKGTRLSRHTYSGRHHS